MKNSDDSTIADASLAFLLSFHPAPWRITYHKQKPHWTEPCVSGVEDANGKSLLECETFSGDGDKVNIGETAMIALVSLVNALANAQNKI